MAENSLILKVNTTYYPTLDLFRAISAFFVVFEHVRNFLLIDYNEIKEKNNLIKCVYFFSGLGHEFVLVFFVLSGCVIGRIPLDLLKNDKIWTWSKYLISRLTRLWTVLIPALILTWILDTVTLQIAPPDSFVFKGGGFAHMELSQVLVNRLRIDYFLGNIFFLQTILVPTFGSNGVLWSLANEFWYYMVYPLLLLPFTYYKNRLTTKFLLLLLGLIILFLVGNIAFDLPIWLMGAFAYIINTRITLKKNVVKIYLSLSLVFFIIALVLSRLQILDGISSSYLIGGTFSLCLIFALKVNMPEPISIISKFLSNFSFSLYAIHAPILTLLIAKFITNNQARLSPDTKGIIILFIIILSIYIISYIFYLFTEKNTTLVRSFLENKILFVKE